MSDLKRRHARLCMRRHAQGLTEEEAAELRAIKAQMGAAESVQEPTDQYDDLLAVHPSPFELLADDYAMLMNAGDLGGVKIWSAG